MLNIIFGIKLFKVSKTIAFLFLLPIFFVVNIVNAFDELPLIEINSLGDFQKEFSVVAPERELHGQALTGQVTYRKGENYSVSLPFGIQKISYLVKNGHSIKKGEIIAKIEGYEVHHFLDEYQSVQAVFEASKQHYLTNRSHFNNKTLKSSEWLDISKSYFDAKLELEHFEHQLSFLHIDENDNVYFISPEKGIVNLDNVHNSKSAGDLAFEIINDESVKVKILVPITQHETLKHFNVTPVCKLTVENVELLAKKYHKIIWATPDFSHCKFTLGQSITVSPVYQFNGYKVPKSSLFEFNDIDYIAVKVSENLQLHPVNIVSSDHQYAYISTDEQVSGKEVLASSVSIVQGILLNLGAE